MREIEDRLRTWYEAGLLSEEQVTSIAAYERGHAGERAGSEAGRRRSLAAEAVGYVGAALAVGAIARLLGELWLDLTVGGRITLVALLTFLLLAGAAALRTTDRAPVQRLTSVLATGGVLGVAWLTVLVADDVLGWNTRDVALAVGVVTTATALPLYLLRPRALPQLTLLAAVITLVGSVLARPVLEPDPVWIGLTFWVLGAAWLLLGAGRWLAPRQVAGVAGAVVALVGLQVSSFDDARLLMLLLAVATAGALVALAVVRDELHHLVVGAVGLFVLVPQVVFELFSDAIGAPATLLVVGLLLGVNAVGIGRVRLEVEPRATTVRSGDDR